MELDNIKIRYKINHDNRIKDNVTVTSSNFSRKDGTIRILAHFVAKKS